MSSVHFPTPVSRSGVMFAAVSHGIPSSAQLLPPPSVPAFTGKPGAFQSSSEWQYTQPLTAVTRYRPRSSRCGEGSNRRSDSGRTFGPMIGRMPITAGTPTTTTTSAPTSSRMPATLPPTHRDLPWNENAVVQSSRMTVREEVGVTAPLTSRPVVV